MTLTFLDKLNIITDTTASFFVPVKQNLKVSRDFIDRKNIAALVPSYKPKMITYKLVKSMLKWYPALKIIFIDDSTPKHSRNYEVVKRIKELSHRNSNLIYLRTPENRLKAGALNYGLDYAVVALPVRPNIILTLDDDVIINKKTIPTLVKSLYSDVDMGAVCTLAKVKNKNKNYLTRLQSYEYHNFNVTKIADNGFLKGPLVMPGMLTALRYAAIADVSKFTTGHLIEDYDLTAKLKVRGWKVGIAKDSSAWTEVPETLGALWKQRVRWTLGGLMVVKDYWKNTLAVFQDLFGHILFISLFAFVSFSFLFACNSCDDDPALVVALTLVAVVNFLAANSFNILAFLNFPRRDVKDWIIKLSMVPEFAYSNFMTMILIGSYLYFSYRLIMGKLAQKVKAVEKINKAGLSAFARLGYSYSWGTKSPAFDNSQTEEVFSLKQIRLNTGGEVNI